MALTAAALGMSLVLGTAFLLIQHFRPAVGSLDHPAHPMTDSQTMAQVLEPAKQIVGIAQLRAATAGYMLMSCRNLRDPPYQGAVYLDFQMSTTTKGEAPVYLQKIADTLVADGWTEGLPPNQHPFGHTVLKNGVTAIFYQNPDQPSFGTMQLYGECRNSNDHARDSTAWTDVTNQLH